MKKVLILGGTQFIGRNLVDRLQKVGHYHLTLFNRGLTRSDLFPKLRKILGDRDTDAIRQISSEHWDFVIDLSCYFPDSLSRVLESLQEPPEKYIFISTCSVYDNSGPPVMLRNEDAATLSCDDRQRNDPGPGSYGHRKAACEQILQDGGLDHVILRPALVYGPYDHTDRFYYWLHQVRSQSTLLLPDQGERKFSLTYVTDLVEAICQAMTIRTASTTFNVISQPQASIGQIVEVAQQLLARRNELLNASPDFLHDSGKRPWVDIPLWLDSDRFTYANERLLNELQIQPTELRRGMQATVEYYRSLHWPDPTYGITAEDRQALLNKLKAQGD
ncbi:MAG: NAD-dependent epimerase/dehydratase family protein [Saprospiraceae bacterium]|nr:NAD-dependent epimerase/dehydratase family protein [Saprospiraceae bacterium]